MLFVPNLGIMPVVFIFPFLLVGFIILLVKGGAAVRWFFGILLLLAVTGIFFGLFSVRAARPLAASESVRSVAAAAESVSQGATLHIIKNDVVWRKGLEEELTPDVYSSPNTAAYGLGIQLQETIQTALGDQLPEKIHISDSTVDVSVLEQLRRGLSYSYEDIKIGINGINTPSNEEIGIKLEIHNTTNSPALLTPKDVTRQTGIMRAVVLTGADKHIKEVRFDHRLWLYDSDTFRRQIGQGNWAVITSQDAVVTKEQALQQATDAAKHYLAEQVGLQNVQESDLRDHGFIIDEYTQRLQGLAGPIWRAAVLLDVSPERLQGLQKNKAVAVRQVRRTWVYRVFSLAGMVLLIGVLSMLVNALTKGYYSIVIAVVAIVAVMAFVLLKMLS